MLAGLQKRLLKTSQKHVDTQKRRFSYRPFQPRLSASFTGICRNRLPSFNMAPGQDGASSFPVFPIPLPPDVANGITNMFFREIILFQEEFTMVGATAKIHHQIGNAMKNHIIPLHVLHFFRQPQGGRICHSSPHCRGSFCWPSPDLPALKLRPDFMQIRHSSRLPAFGQFCVAMLALK